MTRERFPSWVLPTVRSDAYRPSRMLRLAATLERDQRLRWPHGFETLTWPLRTVGEVLKCIEHDSAGNVSLVEWLELLRFLEVPSNHAAIDTARLGTMLWRQAENLPRLRLVLLYSLLRARLEPNAPANPVLCSEAVAPFLRASSRVGGLRRAGMLVRALVSRDAATEVLSLAAQSEMPPSELCRSMGVALTPTASTALRMAIGRFVRGQPATEKLARFLAAALNECHPEERAEILNELLLKLAAPKKESSGMRPFVEWLRREFADRSPGSTWSRISPKARAALAKWLGAATYADFHRLVGRLIRRASDLGLTERDQKQLRSRSNFWSNYSTRFQALRVLLPRKSMAALGEEFASSLNTGDIDQIGLNGEEVEVVVFDLGEWTIVEFFRGNGGEIRGFGDKPEIRKRLFDEPISTHDIRSLSEDWRHDHAFCWQNSASLDLLKLGIVPNKGLTRFVGLPMAASSWTPGRGLPPLDGALRAERERSVAPWQRKMDRIEREIRMLFRR